MALVERDFDIHLLNISGNDRRAGVSAPADDGLRLGRTDLGQLCRHVRVFAAEAFRLNDLDAVLRSLGLELFLAAFTEGILDREDARSS